MPSSQNKNFDYFFIICLLSSIFKEQAFASAWLPEKGKYKYTLSHMSTLEKSIKLQQDRLEYANKIEQQIILLDNSLHNIKDLDSRKQISQEIIRLKRLQDTILVYQAKNYSSLSVEYSATDHQSLGGKIDFAQDSLLNTTGSSKNGDFFYKHKIFQNKNYIISIQPQLIFHTSYGNNNDFMQELSLMIGKSQKKKLEFFTDSAIRIGGCVTSTCSGKKYLSIETTQGIKLPYGIMLSTNVKRTERKNYSKILQANIYYQFSIAKEFKIGSVKEYNFATQVGYFTDKKLNDSKYVISGIVLSAWLTI